MTTTNSYTISFLSLGERVMARVDKGPEDISPLLHACRLARDTSFTRQGDVEVVNDAGETVACYRQGEDGMPREMF